ncbi:transglutaminase [Fervidicella metallireducens AeB]|uniref:Transglutaminase n=1 Tax=Fervidicella metallireducens AeB TaxID=1403537 RepID=A0A017RWC1_9CLOT|nr:protein-glutamine gamma-glutamyltransferase [Fervidicella metallireducens]EYE88699.1 transglutaminase [Fervidicella metallireducens AeB]
MIKISETIFPKTFINDYALNPIERKIFQILSESDFVYNYSSLNQLKFEIELRINIIEASKEFNKSKIQFKVFSEARCNPDFWELTPAGGFQLKKDILPAQGIKDIFSNSFKYATECSTAIIIIYYKALLKIFPDELFNTAFQNIYLRNWNYIDSDLNVFTYYKDRDFLPADCRYFKNPDFDPEKSQWQGENVIDLGNDTYFGHGIGIKNTESIVTILNQNRKPNATQSAYLTNSVTNPDYKHLANLYFNYISKTRYKFFKKIKPVR